MQPDAGPPDSRCLWGGLHLQQPLQVTLHIDCELRGKMFVRPQRGITEPPKSLFRTSVLCAVLGAPLCSADIYGLIKGHTLLRGARVACRALRMQSLTQGWEPFPAQGHMDI